MDATRSWSLAKNERAAQALRAIVPFQLLKRGSWKAVGDQPLATTRPPTFEKAGMSLETIEGRFRVICLIVMHALFALLFGLCFAAFHAGIGVVLVIMFLETYVSFDSLQFY